MNRQNILRRAIGIAVVGLSTSLIFGRDYAHADSPQPSANTTPKHVTQEAVAKDAPHADEVKLTAAAVTSNEIKVGPAESRVLIGSILAPARVAFDAEAMAHVGSIVAGRVTDIRVRIGDEVKKNDVLMIVESPELGRAQSDFLQKRTEAEIADAAIAPAKDAYSRARQLFDESQGIALSEVQKREVEQRAAVGNAASATASLQAAQNSLRLFGMSQENVKRLIDTGEIDPRFEVRSPIDGHIIDREVTLGEWVSPEKEKLLFIADTRNFWVLAEVPEARLATVGVGSKAEVQLAALPDEHVVGEVSLVSAEIDPTTRTARLRIVVANDHGKLRPGMFAHALIGPSERETKPSLVIPEDALQTVEGKPSVFIAVAGDANTFARREVVVGPEVNGYLPVLSGLAEGEQVVLAGSFILKAELGKGSAHED